MSTVQPSAEEPQNQQRLTLQMTPEGRAALREAVLSAIHNSGEIDPVLLQRAMAHGLPKQAILDAVVIARGKLQMNPQIDSIKSSHFNKIIALRIEAHRSGQSSVADEDIIKARDETIASINALNCAFVRFVGDNYFLIMRPAEKVAFQATGTKNEIQNRWKEKINVTCEKTQKSPQKSALIDAINSAKVRHCEGQFGNVSFKLKIKSEVIRRMKQLLGEAELNGIIQSRINHIRQVYDDAIHNHVRRNTNEVAYSSRTLKDAVSLGINEKWLNEHAQKEVDKRKYEIRLQKEQEEREKNEALAKVNETMTLRQNSYEGLDRAVECLDLIKQYKICLDARTALVKIVLSSKRSYMRCKDRDKIQRHLIDTMDGVALRSDLTNLKYTDDFKLLMKNDNPLYQGDKGPSIYDKIVYHFIVDCSGFQAFSQYLAAYSTTEQFPSLSLVLSILYSVIHFLGTTRANTGQRKLDCKVYAATVWSALKLHIEFSGLPDEEHGKVKLVADALVAINPDLKIDCSDFLANDQSATETVTEMVTEPAVTQSDGFNNPQVFSSQKAGDHFSATESAEARLKSFSRMQTNVSKLIECATESCNDLKEKMTEAHTHLEKAKASHEIAKEGVNAATTFLTNVKLQGTRAAIDHGTEKVSAAKHFETITEKDVTEATNKYDAAVATYNKSKRMLDEVQSQHSFATKEIEDARAYLKDVERKNEVIDLMDDSPKKPARKKQRRAIKTRSNRISF